MPRIQLSILLNLLTPLWQMINLFTLSTTHTPTSTTPKQLLTFKGHVEYRFPFAKGALFESFEIGGCDFFSLNETFVEGVGLSGEDTLELG